MQSNHAHATRATFPDGRARRSVLNLLFLSVLTTGLLFTSHHVTTRGPWRLADLAATLRAAMDRDTPPAASAYEQELAMAPAALLDRWNPVIADAARRFGISENWIRAVIRMESGGRTMLGDDRPITSRTGAMGLMQLMPDTYAQMRDRYGLGGDAFDPRDNIYAGTAYLVWLRRRYGYPGMFAAYNDGPGKFEDHLYRGRALPAETQHYVAGIQRFLDRAPRLQAAPLEQAKLTRPNGAPILIAVASVRAIRAPMRGEYAAGVHSVISFGKVRQGVRETVEQARALLKA